MFTVSGPVYVLQVERRRRQRSYTRRRRCRQTVPWVKDGAHPSRHKDQPWQTEPSPHVSGYIGELPVITVKVNPCQSSSWQTKTLAVYSPFGSSFTRRMFRCCHMQTKYPLNNLGKSTNIFFAQNQHQKFQYV